MTKISTFVSIRLGVKDKDFSFEENKNGFLYNFNFLRKNDVFTYFLSPTKEMG